MEIMVWSLGRNGGGPRYNYEIIKNLSQHQNISVHVAYSKQSSYALELESLKGIRKFRLSTYTNIFGFFLSLLRLPLIKKKLRAYLIKEKISLVYCTMDHLWNPILAKVFIDLKIPYILTVHDAQRHPGEDDYWRNWILSKDIGLSDGVLVLTNSVEKDIKQLYKYPSSRICKTVHGHFGDYVLKKPRKFPLSRPFRLLFFGRILEYKGLPLLIEAFSKLNEKYSLELEVAGQGNVPPIPKTGNLRSSLIIHNRWIEESEFATIFLRADLLVLPYIEASQSGVAAMAQAYGLPSVITPIPGLMEQIKHGVNGFVSAGTSSTELKRAIETIVSDKDLYEGMSLNCINIARTDLNWELIVNNLVSDINKFRVLGPRDKDN